MDANHCPKSRYELWEKEVKLRELANDSFQGKEGINEGEEEEEEGNEFQNVFGIKCCNEVKDIIMQ